MTALQRGFVFALLATIAFGITTPIIAVFGSQAGVWPTAGWLYLGGAAFAFAAHRKPRRLVRGLRANWLLLAAIAVVGGMLAPAAYIIGLHDAGPLATSLALNMEAPFSALIAAVLFREYLGARAITALLVIAAGACALAPGIGIGAPAHLGSTGLLLVILATALWAGDNALSSRLADLDPRITIFWKGAGGGALSLLVGLLLGQNPGTPATIALLLLIGAIGYGASLLFYLVAQRQFGVARTASVFAIAPFIGAAGAVVGGHSRPSAIALVASAAMIVGVWLHVTERHRHEHRHDALEHEHTHRHDDLHHDHAHEAASSHEHSHRHRHTSMVHTHEHAPDPEHAHRH